MRYIKIVILMLTMVFTASASNIKTGEELNRVMHIKHSGRWYKTLTFVQKNTIYKPE